MRRAFYNPRRSDLASFQRPPRVRAPAVKHVNLLVGLDDANKMPPDLVYLHLACDEIHFPGQLAPPHRQHEIKFHGISNAPASDKRTPGAAATEATVK